MTGSVADLLSQARGVVGGQVALVEPETGRTFTWAELDDEVDRIAAGLAELGLVAGYRVMLLLTNRIEFVTAYLALLRARLVAVPVNPRSATGEVARITADCGARAIFADATTITMARSAIAGLQDALVDAAPELSMPVPLLITVGTSALPGETSYQALAASTATTTAVSENTDPESLAVLLYTSGTSGRPRAAMLSHRALLANIEQAASIKPPMISGSDVILGVLPLFHVYGLNAVLGAVLRQHAKLVVVDGFDARESLDVIADHQVTVVPVAPPVFGYWRRLDDADTLADRLGGVRLLLSGSAPLSPEVAQEFTASTGKPVHQGYGLTEAAPIVTSTLVGGHSKPGSVGRPLPGVQVRIVDSDDELPDDGDVGELQVCGPNLFSGYWPDGAEGPGSDGWYGTGDIGYLDDEGDLFLVDRLKELVIVSGFNVYPTEIEDFIAEIPGVGEVAVIGAPDSATGEAVVAYVVPSSVLESTGDADPMGSATGERASELEAVVRDRCASGLASFKQPQEIYVVEELPKTITGKVAKGRLRAARRRANLGLL
ncbi:MAG: AMP-binding protein [Nocardioidaceae bacterium]|nr:MAG: AMP-binding protein [Nocardioidaceae bacterium]